MISRLILLFKSLPSSSSSVKSTFGLRSEHPTKIRGHPEGESALGASVACRKAARWCQPDVDILYFQSIGKYFNGGCPYLSMALNLCLTRLLCVGVSRWPRIDLDERSSPGLEEKAVGRPKG